MGISPTPVPSRANMPPAMLHVRSSDPVQTAVDKINRALSESVTDWDVGHGDLMDARNALNGLSPSQVNQVISRLSDSTLRNWNSEMNGLRGGLNANEKRDQFNFLAQSLNADQLARVSQQFRYGNDAQQFAVAVGRFRDATTVGQFAAKVLSTPDRDTATAWNNNANLAANAVGQMDSSAKLNTALGALTADQRAKMLNGTVWAPKGIESTAFNKLTDTIARFGTLQQRTEAFNTIAEHNAKFRDNLGSMPFSSQNFPALNAPYAAMKKLFAADPRGMTELMYRQNTGMRSLTNFLEVAVIKGDFKLIGEWGLRIRPGAGETDARRFAISGAFTGAAMTAAINVNLDEGKRRDLAMSLVTGGLSTVAAALPVGGQIAIGAGSTIGQPVLKSILEAAGKSREEFFSALQDAGMPRNANGELPIDGRRTAFSGAVGEVLDAHAYR